MKVIFDNDLLSLCAGAVISCVYIAMISDFIYRAVKHGIRGMAVFRVFSAVSAMALVISGLTANGFLYHAMSSDIALSSMIILVAGSAGARYQEEIPLAVLASLLFASSLAVAVIRLILPSESGEAGISCWIPVILSVSVILFTFVKSVSDFSGIREFLKGMTARKYAHAVVTCHFCYLYMGVVLLGASSMTLSGAAGSFMSVLCTVGMLVLHVGLYLRISRDTVFILYDGFEADFTGRMEQILHPEESRTRSDSGYRTTYERLNAFFEDRKPYLDCDLTIADIAKELYTNKLYVSKSINLCTGKNFCQYVNYHRVKYSMELFRADPHLKVSQLAEMSGFHTVASYNMAFKLIMNESPGEWCRRHRFCGGGQFEKSET